MNNYNELFFKIDPTHFKLSLIYLENNKNKSIAKAIKKERTIKKTWIIPDKIQSALKKKSSIKINSNFLDSETESTEYEDSDIDDADKDSDFTISEKDCEAVEVDKKEQDVEVDQLLEEDSESSAYEDSDDDDGEFSI